MLYFDELQQKFNDNSSITRSEFNALVQAVQRISNPQGGYGFQSGDAANLQFDKSIEVPSWFPVRSTPSVPLYSVFTLKANSTGVAYYPLMVEIEKITANSNRIVLLTNANVYNSNTGGLARIIDWFTPIILRTHTDTTTNPLPTAGETCGPIDDSFEVAANGHGLICLAISEDEKYVQCVAAQPGGRWLVKPVSNIAKGGGKGDVILWRGPDGAEVETNPQIKFKPCNRTSADCVQDKFAEMVAIGGRLYVVPWECEPAGTEPPVTPATSVASASDNFDRTIGNDINVGAEYPYTAVFGSAITDFMVVARSGADHACQLDTDDSAVVLAADVITAQTKDFLAEIEPFDLAHGDEAGVVLSYLDDNNTYSVYGTKAASDFTINIRRREAGVPTVLATSVVALPPGTKHWVVGKVDLQTGFIYGYIRDENYVKSAIIQAVHVPNGGNKVGFGCGSISGPSNDLDNFRVDETHFV